MQNRGCRKNACFIAAASKATKKLLFRTARELAEKYPTPSTVIRFLSKLNSTRSGFSKESCRLRSWTSSVLTSASIEEYFLFNTGRGKVVWYEPAKHGIWEIAKTTIGALTVRLVDGVGENTEPLIEAAAATEDAYSMFALEAHLRDYLAKNLPKLPGLSMPLMLYRTEDRDGVEFQTDVGPIDILATSNDDFYIFELKLGRGPDATMGQILRYMGWVKEHLASSKNVYGVIVASDIGQKLRYAATQVSNVRLMEYDLKVELRGVSLRG
jgi:RecB family endonuclease NucS